MSEHEGERGILGTVGGAVAGHELQKHHGTGVLAAGAAVLAAGALYEHHKHEKEHEHDKHHDKDKDHDKHCHDKDHDKHHDKHHH